MSTDYTTHLGPYVVCEFSRIKKDRMIRTCVNNACSIHNKKHEVYDKEVKFCSKCGKPIEEVAFPTTVQSVNAHEVSELFEQALYEAHEWTDKNNKHIWLPNRHYGSIFKDIKVRNASLQEIPVNAIAEDLAKFNAFYEKEIKILKSQYGEDKVEIKWGFVHSTW